MMRPKIEVPFRTVPGSWIESPISASKIEVPFKPVTGSWIESPISAPTEEAFSATSISETIAAHNTEHQSDGPPPGTRRIPRRIIVCVDGTHCTPDGALCELVGSQTNISRLFNMVAEGQVLDIQNREWEQFKEYVPGIKDDTLSGLNSGFRGIGVKEQIKRVYRYCCRHATSKEDEIFLFGFSRGAYTVSAVASLFVHLGFFRNDANSDEFKHHLHESLELLPEIIGTAKGKECKFKHAIGLRKQRTRDKEVPILKFVGLFDAVKYRADFDDMGQLSSGELSKISHVRHALALNERRNAFLPEFIAESDTQIPVQEGTSHTFVQAWFLGTHADLGGGNKEDGLSLHPLQWIVAEAQRYGLGLSGHAQWLQSEAAKEDPTREDIESTLFPPKQKYEYTTRNRVEVTMWNILSEHVHSRYKLVLNNAGETLMYKVHGVQPRRIFEESGDLLGQAKDGRGTIIHPAVYMILDIDNRVRVTSKSWPWHRHLVQQRDMSLWQMPPGDYDPEVVTQKYFWYGVAEDDPNLRFRILTVGFAGVGKSTLINKAFGVPESAEKTRTSNFEHGEHDINAELTVPGGQYVIHDSQGFDAGDESNILAVKNFLHIRLAQDQPPSQSLHAVWYCISSDANRSLAATKKFFQALTDCDKAVPVIVVFTKADKLYRDQQEEANKVQSDKTGKDQSKFNKKDKECVAQLCKTYQEQHETKWRIDLEQLGNVSSIVYTCHRDPKSIKSLMAETINNLQDRLIQLRCISAQMCSPEAKVEAAIRESITLYKRGICISSIPLAFSGVVGASCFGGKMCVGIMGMFGGPGFDLTMALVAIKLAFANNSAANGAQAGAQLATGAAVSLLEVGTDAVEIASLFTAGVGAAMVSFLALPQFGRLLLMLMADTILIMERAYWLNAASRSDSSALRGEYTPITAEEIKQASEDFWNAKGGRGMAAVHEDITKLLSLWKAWDAHRYGHIENVLTEIIEKRSISND